MVVCFVQLLISELNHIFRSVVLSAHCPRQHWLLLKILETITALTFQLLIPPLWLLPGLKHHWILHDPSPHTPGDSVASAPPLTLSPLPGATATSASEAPPPSLYPPHPPPVTTSTSPPSPPCPPCPPSSPSSGSGWWLILILPGHPYSMQGWLVVLCLLSWVSVQQSWSVSWWPWSSFWVVASWSWKLLLSWILLYHLHVLGEIHF